MMMQRKFFYISEKVQGYLFECFVYFQFIMIQKNIHSYLGNKKWISFLIVITIIQDLQLINGQSILFQEIFYKYQINTLIYYNSLGFEIISYIVVIGLVCYIIFLKILIKYQTSIHHEICFFIIQATYHLLSIPIMYNFIYKAHAYNYQSHNILLVLSMVLNLFFITFNCQISITEIEGNFCRTNDELLQYVTRLLLCILKIQFPVIDAQLSVLLTLNVLLIIRQLNVSNKCNFILNTRIFKVIFCVAGLCKFGWIEIIIVYLLAQKTIVSIQKSFEDHFLMNINETKINLILQFISTYYLEFNFIKILFVEEYFRKNSKTLLSSIGSQNIQNRILIETYLDNNINKLHLNLIKMKKEGLCYLDSIYAQANLHRIAQFYNQSHSTHNQEMILKIIQAEQDNLDTFDKILQLRLKFFTMLEKNIQIEQSKHIITRASLEYCEKMQAMKFKLEERIDFQNLTLRNSPHSDYITLQTIQIFYMVFFVNYSKAAEISFRMKELTNWNRTFNIKLKNNQILLFQVSHLLQKGKIINKNSRSIREYFIDEKVDNFQSILPSFLKDEFYQQVQNYITSGFMENAKLDLFLLKDQFLVPCKISLYHSMINDDLIINKLVELESQEDLLLFNRQGQIIGITKQLFLALKEESGSEIFDSLTEFLKQSQIQYFIADIQFQIYSLISQKNSQHQFKSHWNQIQIPNTSFEGKTNSNLKLQQDLLQYLTNSLDPESFSPIYYNKEELNNESQPLCFNFELSFKKSDNFSKEGYFILKFLDLKNYQDQIAENQDFISLNESQVQKNSYLKLNQQTLIQSILQRKKLSINLIMQISTLCGIAIYALLTLFINNADSKNEIVSYQNSVNFLINPQALTFSLAAAFLLQWNNYCAQNQLYNLSKYVEYQRQQKLIYAYRLWDSVNINYTLNLSIRSQELGLGQVEVVDYDANNNKIVTQMAYYSFYTIIREKLVRGFRNTNFTNISTADYSIFRANGFIRQNILTVFKYHDFVMNNEIEYLVQKVGFSQNKFEMILFLEIFLIVPLSIFFTRLILNFIRLMNKQFKLIYHIDASNIQLMLAQTKLLSENLFSSQKYLIYHEQLEIKEPEQKKNQAKRTAQKLHNFQPFNRLGISVPIFCFLFYLGLMMGVLYYRTSYYSKYQDSLLMAMKYIKFKKHFDNSILLGELIKTEHLIPKNPYHLINQTDSVQYFFSQANNATVIFNEILENLISSTYFNETMKITILSAFKDNLCINFTKFLPFCSVTKIKLPYYTTDTYTGLIQNGIGGIIQNYNNLIQSEFSKELQTQSYDFEMTHSKQYLNSQLHQNFFVQYAQDIQSCFFTCFSYFIQESRSLSALFISVLSQYYLISGIIYTLIILIISLFWIYVQYNKIQKLKLILTLLNPQLLSQKLIYQQLMNIDRQL